VNQLREQPRAEAAILPFVADDQRKRRLIPITLPIDPAYTDDPLAMLRDERQLTVVVRKTNPRETIMSGAGFERKVTKVAQPHCLV
jgi:hypothetical protein